jgi:YVTN family beta-propeller protein
MGEQGRVTRGEQMLRSDRGQGETRVWAALVVGLVLGAARTAVAGSSFVLFESGQVRPLALSPDRTRLFAVNTPDNRLEVFAVGASGLTKTGSVGVGMEPVAVAARTDTEVWVVNHLSDSVSIVDVSGTPRVVRTLLVGDEPRDIVFAGPGGNRAFVTTARRGQNVPASVPPLLTTPSTPRALVWVFDATNLGNTLEGVPLTIVELFGDTPRALAASPDGTTVYAAVFHSGNQTTTVSEGAVCDDPNLNDDIVAGPCTVVGVTMPGGLPNPERNVDGVPRRETGLIVKFDNALGQWRDGLGRNWNNAVKFTLPDLDVFKIDATANPPAQIGVDADQYAHVGTVLFNMVVNPVNNKVYVSNGDAHNEVRFEGPGIVGGSTVRGHLHEARVTVLDGSAVLPRHLNKHIDYSAVPSPPGTADASLATPVGMAVSSDGTTLYVTGFGSQKIGVYDTAKLEADAFHPELADGVTYVPLAGGGPSGVVLDETNHRLYVLTRFDNSVSVVNTDTLAEEPALKQPLYNPEPASVVVGRHYLYDAAFTSSNGEASCSSCHTFGDFDSLAWDLGNPDDSVLNNPNPIRLGPIIDPSFHPIKGPMTTQSLRGMANNGPMHWRGDRTGGNDPGGDPLDENAAFLKFNVAFNSLLGRSDPIPDDDMQQFADFILQVTYPPNPIRNLDNSLTPEQAAGRAFFMNNTVDTLRCNDCHRLDPAAGFFATDGFSSFENEPQVFKIPHLRNVYQKIGMFGMPAVPFINTGDNGAKGPQVRGFGVLHDGSIDTVFRFLRATVFVGFAGGATGNTQRQQAESFVLAFDSNLAPIVGQQVTLTDATAAPPEVLARLDLLDQRADSGECDVIVKGVVSGLQRGWVRQAGGLFRSDRASDPPLSAADLRAGTATPGQALTYTAVPVGAGVRMGIDRDEDGYLDRDELDGGSNPADPLSVPAGTSAAIVPVPARRVLIKNALPDDVAKNRITLLAKSASIVTPDPGSVGDPRCNGAPDGTAKATLVVSSATSGQSHATDLPCQNWKLLGSAADPKGYAYRDKKLAAGTARIVVWKSQDKLKARLLGKGPTVLNYDLQSGVDQDPVDVQFIAGGSRVCMQCTGVNGRNGSDGKLFRGRNCSAPASCPP